MTSVDYYDKLALQQLDWGSELAVGQTVNIGLEPSHAAHASDLRRRGANVAYFLRLTSAWQSLGKDDVAWHAVATVDRSTGEFLGSDGAKMTAGLRKLDPAMASFPSLLSWVKEDSLQSRSGTSKRLAEILLPTPNPVKWEDTDPAGRSLEQGDIPPELRKNYVEIGIALAWSNGPPGSILAIRAPSGVVHSAGAGSGDHLATGFAKPGDKLSLDLCRHELQDCTSLGTVKFGDRPILVVDVAGDVLTRFVSLDDKDGPKQVLAAIPATLQMDAKSYLDNGILDDLGKPPKN